MGFKIVNGLAGGVFLVSAALQLNDPDPLRWTALYLAGAGACLLHHRAPRYRWPAALVAVAALAWAASMLGIVPRIAFADLFKTMKAGTPLIEESREFLGLVLVGCWMLVLSLRSRRQTGG